MSSLNNAAGLKPEESKALQERQMHAHEEPIVTALHELYTCKPTDTSFDIYAKNAVFQDPIGIAEGVDSIRAQFIALPKLFPRADITSFRILQGPEKEDTNTLLIDQNVDYFHNPNGSSPMKTINSLLTLKLNDQGKIIDHTEEWNHK